MNPVQVFFDALDNPSPGAMETMLGMLTEDVEWLVVPYGAVSRGRAAVRASLQTALANAAPIHTITTMFGGDGRICAEYTARTTIAPGRLERLNLTVTEPRTLNVMTCGVFEIRDGRIAKAKEYFDLATLLRQLGQ